MKLKIQSEKDFILKGIIEQVKNFKPKDKHEYSGNLHSSLSHLVQLYIRDIAQKASEKYERLSGNELVKQAVKQIETELNRQLKELQIEFNFTKYFNNIDKVLEYPSNEIAELGKKLLSANLEKRIGNRERQDDSIYRKNNIPIEIIELGLRSSIDGLLVNPLSDSYEIDLGNVRNKYPLQGDWFPFEVIIDDFTFTIDDDGTIFVSVEKIPDKSVIEAKIRLRELANELYVPVEQPSEH